MTIDELRAEIENKLDEYFNVVDLIKKNDVRMKLTDPIFDKYYDRMGELTWVLSLIEKGE